MESDTRTPLRLADGAGWTFLGGRWTEDAGGALCPPDGTDVEYLAVRDGAVYGDFEATFRFRLRAATPVRFLFRLQDSRRFYAFDVPFGGQQFRSRTCWAGMVVADGTPLQRYLSFGMMPGLCAVLGSWYDVRVRAEGRRLQAWINDIPAADVEDDTYRSGRIGLGSIQTPYPDAARFDALRIDGTPGPPGAWDGLTPAAQHWITPCPETDPDTYQSYATLLKSGPGRATLYLTFGNPNHGETRRAVLIRTEDGGRSWGEPEPAPNDGGLGGAFVRRDGTWVSMRVDHEDEAEPLRACESVDGGRTWHGTANPEVAGGWPSEWRAGGPWPPVRMSDGSLVLPMMVSPPDEPVLPTQCQYVAAMALRSEDDGRTWSAPVLCDADARQQHLPPAALRYAARYYEVAIDEPAPGVLVGIGRPDRDPYMWQLRSEDGGRTWQPAAIGQFPGFCPSLTATRSGALVATTRYPHFAAHLSRDGGRTWSAPIIVDYAIWGNQHAVEIEPDVVLVTYMGHIMQHGQADSRIARLRVTDEGLTLDN